MSPLRWLALLLLVPPLLLVIVACTVWVVSTVGVAYAVLGWCFYLGFMAWLLLRRGRPDTGPPLGDRYDSRELL